MKLAFVWQHVLSTTLMSEDNFFERLEFNFISTNRKVLIKIEEKRGIAKPTPDDNTYIVADLNSCLRER